MFKNATWPEISVCWIEFRLRLKVIEDKISELQKKSEMWLKSKNSKWNSVKFKIVQLRPFYTQLFRSSVLSPKLIVLSEVNFVCLLRKTMIMALHIEKIEKLVSIIIFLIKNTTRHSNSYYRNIDFVQYSAKI